MFRPMEDRPSVEVANGDMHMMICTFGIVNSSIARSIREIIANYPSVSRFILMVTAPQIDNKLLIYTH